ncbi:hypothetical protein [uncultured Pseudodesulfovibrio sp.]|uniref:hypothetical protein n=1 Tax=uncultured Pseudodesulfovibrio sp. TaxID=2035858 RepID=UPI0029C7C378|nr:hypothetical protein [uncultured Pseudodesulfovibrio sp.]
MSSAYSYVLTYNHADAKLKKVLSFLRDCDEISSWYAPFHGTAILISFSDAETLSELFIDHFPGCDHLIVDIQDDEPDYSGWLDDDVWDYVNEPDNYA